MKLRLGQFVTERAKHGQSWKQSKGTPLRLYNVRVYIEQRSWTLIELRPRGEEEDNLGTTSWAPAISKADILFCPSDCHRSY